MPGWEVNQGGGLRLVWSSPDDLLTFIRSVVDPAALTYGFRVTVERVPKEETAADRV
jgi:hypothetical protein